jgi:tetraprenyl-beta-curcumene synthase
MSTRHTTNGRIPTDLPQPTLGSALRGSGSRRQDEVAVRSSGRVGRCAEKQNRRGWERPFDRQGRWTVGVEDRVQLVRAFIDTVVTYQLRVLPLARVAMAHWQAKAQAIPAVGLREAADRALTKRGNIEGAVLFATLAPAADTRWATVRAIVAFQTAYNYADALSEVESDHPQANADQLHQALLCALHPEAEEVDYYEYYPGDDDDGGFLTDLVGVCRCAVASLPAWDAAAPLAREAAGRIADFQTLNLPDRYGAQAALSTWGSEVSGGHPGLLWWEGAAAGGSSLAVHALVATAADRGTDGYLTRAVADSYFPWAGAVHSLLDSLVDREEDADLGQQSLLDYYADPWFAAWRLGALASASCDALEALPNASKHRVILTAMCSYYLSSPERYTREGSCITKRLTSAIGWSLPVATTMFRSKRLLHFFAGERYV